MIVDIGNEIFTQLKSTLSPIKILTETPSVAPSFPCVVFEELLTDTDSDTVDTSGEKFNQLSFEINIYSIGDTKKSVAKTIRNQIDTIMSGQYRMTRKVDRPISNYLDQNIFRYTLRYTCKVDSNKVIYKG